MHSYWAQIFILPKKIIQMVEAGCNKFISSGGQDSEAEPHVAWSHVCLPKSCRGLNLSWLDLWNKDAMLKSLWSFAQKKDRLWIR